METLLVNCTIKLEKFPGKGGWTYAPLPGVTPDKTNPFGWIKVKGTVDDYCIRQYHVMPMGNGNLFLPVKAAIRKAIKKQEGDFVHILLYRDDEPPVVQPDFLDCLQDEPAAWFFFQQLSGSEQKAYIDHINAAIKDETRINRLVNAINKLAAGKKFLEKNPQN